ncbi:hypothetical protein IWX49DRAFT_237621 [Phyllosticta citricarpa]
MMPMLLPTYAAATAAAADADVDVDANRVGDLPTLPIYLPWPAGFSLLVFLFSLSSFWPCSIRWLSSISTHGSPSLQSVGRSVGRAFTICDS